MNIIRRFRDYLQLREAVKRADEAHEKDGGRYYVMPSNDGKLIIMDRKNFRKLKQKGYISRKAMVNNLISESFYFTPYANGDGYISEGFRKAKVMMYYSWCETMRKIKKNGKRKDGKQKEA